MGERSGERSGSCRSLWRQHAGGGALPSPARAASATAAALAGDRRPRRQPAGTAGCISEDPARGPGCDRRPTGFALGRLRGGGRALTGRASTSPRRPQHAVVRLNRKHDRRARSASPPATRRVHRRRGRGLCARRPRGWISPARIGSTTSVASGGDAGSPSPPAASAPRRAPRRACRDIDPPGAIHPARGSSSTAHRATTCGGAAPNGQGLPTCSAAAGGPAGKSVYVAPMTQACGSPTTLDGALRHRSPRGTRRFVTAAATVAGSGTHLRRPRARGVAMHRGGDRASLALAPGSSALRPPRRSARRGARSHRDGD